MPSDFGASPTQVGVDGLIPVVCLDDVSATEIPAGWQIGQVDSPTPLPILRMALFRTSENAPWIACETLTAFNFQPPMEPATQRSENTLRRLAADSVITTPLRDPLRDERIGSRSSGFFALAGRRLWAQCSIYMQENLVSPLGLVIEQVVFVDVESRAWLRDDIEQLTAEVHAAVSDAFDSFNPHRSQGRKPDGS